MGVSKLVSTSGIGICTSLTRPANPYNGQHIYETNTFRTLVYDGTGWVIMSEPTQSYTQTFNINITPGNGVSAAYYSRSDGWCQMWSRFTFGTTTAVAGTPVALTLPIAAANLGYGQLSVTMSDVSAGQNYNGTNGDNTISPILYYWSLVTAGVGSPMQLANIQATTPFTWAVNDVIYVSGRYRMVTRYS